MNLLDPELTPLLRYAEADLVSDVVELDGYVRHGPPPSLRDVPVAEELRTVIRSVEPADLGSPTTRALWCAVRHLYAEDQPLTWETIVCVASKWSQLDAVTHCADELREIGMAVPLKAKGAAKTLLQLAAARDRFREAQDLEARAVEDIRAVLIGVAA